MADLSDPFEDDTDNEAQYTNIITTDPESIQNGRLCVVTTEDGEALLFEERDEDEYRVIEDGAYYLNRLTTRNEMYRFDTVVRADVREDDMVVMYSVADGNQMYDDWKENAEDLLERDLLIPVVPVGTPL